MFLGSVVVVVVVVAVVPPQLQPIYPTASPNLDEDSCSTVPHHHSASPCASPPAHLGDRYLQHQHGGVPNLKKRELWKTNFCLIWCKNFFEMHQEERREHWQHLWHKKTGSMIFWIASRHIDLLNPWKTTVHQIPSHAISIPVHRLSARRLNWQENFRPATGSVKRVV